MKPASTAEHRLVHAVTPERQERPPTAIDRRNYGETPVLAERNGKKEVKIKPLYEVADEYAKLYGDHFAKILAELDKRNSLTTKAKGVNAGTKYENDIYKFYTTINAAHDAFIAKQEDFEGHLRTIETLFAELEADINENSPDAIQPWAEKQYGQWSKRYLEQAAITGYDWNDSEGHKVALDIPERWEVFSPEMPATGTPIAYPSHDINGSRRRVTIVFPKEMKGQTEKFKVRMPTRDLNPLSSDDGYTTVDAYLGASPKGIATMKLILPTSDVSARRPIPLPLSAGSSDAPDNDEDLEADAGEVKRLLPVNNDDGNALPDAAKAANNGAEQLPTIEQLAGATFSKRTPLERIVDAEDSPVAPTDQA